jgi:exodeoxyribonuclease VII large subunit
MTVSQVVPATNRLFDRSVGTIWIEGEIASLSRPASGHVYFALRDRNAEIRAVMWRSAAQRMKFELEEGSVVHCGGRLGVYERDGKFQFYVERAVAAGVGADALALAQLKQRLAAEGLFDPSRKRPLPALPTRIGVVTSRTGAAIRDIIRAVQRRFPVPILVADCQVQGPSAASQIKAALVAIARTDVSVVIVGRGGGSAKDLSAFDDERVVRAVAACPVPTIAAVGHEVDTSLTCLVADRRAATPSMAGEMAVPVLADLAASLRQCERRLARELALRFAGARQELDHLATAARHHYERGIGRRRRLLEDARAALGRRHPSARLVADRAALESLQQTMDGAVARRLELARRDVGSLAGRLNALSPLEVLERGYSIVRRDRRVITTASDVAVGDSVTVRFARGSIDCQVERVDPDGIETAP